MAWEWSHTLEAYRDAELNLRDLSDDIIAEIYAEWRASVRGEFDWVFRSERYALTLDSAKRKVHTYQRELMEDYIWEHASENATSDHGGFNAWLCPYGCGCHCVPFDREDTD